MFDNMIIPEKAILIGLDTGKGDGDSLLEELKELVITAGAEVVALVLQKRNRPDAAHFIGTGKLMEIKELAENHEANLLVFDDELSGAQVRNIEELTNLKVVDRTTTILDIFANRARTKEGRLQVELAQQKYRLPRLMGVGTALSRLGGGIGTRGPGETKLEADRRHIRRRITFLERELKELTKRRGYQREARKKNDIPVIALVGYTNTGKSTLMNKLCNTEVMAEDMLFATLDPTARKLELPSGRECILVDTVGFIRKLPHDLVNAFKSTLEEAIHADVLLHVADINSAEADVQIKVVNSILDELKANRENMLLVLNKIDLIEAKNNNHELPQNPFRDNNSKGSETFEISAFTGKGLEKLLEGIENAIPKGQIHMKLIVPYNEGWVMPFIHENGILINSEFKENGIFVEGKLPVALAGKLEAFSIEISKPAEEFSEK